MIVPYDPSCVRPPAAVTTAEVRHLSSCDVSTMMKPAMLALAAAALTAQAAGRSTYGDVAMPAAPPGSDCAYPANCPDKVLPRKDKQTWQMNQSTIIMPCNNTGFTDPSTTLGWGIVDFDWSNGKGTGTADGWVKHSPMDDEELLFKQVQMTAAATPGTTVWIYRCSVYAYPWYTSVRKLLDDDAYAPWFLDFNNQSGPLHNTKCDNNFSPPKCSNHFHMQEQSPGYPHGDGDCAAPGCDCGKAPCGFYLWNHSSTAVVHGQTFQDWFVNDFMLNKYGMSPLVSGFFWDDFWPAPGGGFPDALRGVAEDTGLDQDHTGWAAITEAYHQNMDALRTKTLAAGKFAWQLMWTGGAVDGVGNTCPHSIVSQKGCAAELRSLCNETAPPQTRAMMYAINAHRPNVMPEVKQDLANFLLIRGPFAWLGHGWKGRSQEYPFPPEFNLDYVSLRRKPQKTHSTRARCLLLTQKASTLLPVRISLSLSHARGLITQGEPVDKVCKETAPNSGIFTREWSKASVQMDCATWTPTIKMK